MSLSILHLIDSLDPAAGGPVEAIVQISASLSARGNHVEIATCSSPARCIPLDARTPVHSLGEKDSFGGFGFTRKLVPWLDANAARFDAVFVHGLWQYPSLAAWRSLRASTTPYFVFPHGMLDPWFTKASPANHLKKAIYWKLIQSRILRDAKRVFYTCDEERRLARKTFHPYSCKETVIHYGIHPPQYDPEKVRKNFIDTFPQYVGKRIILFLGRLHEKKGCDLLIRAFQKEMPAGEGWHLMMAGPASSPDYLSKLRELAMEDPSSSISFPGMLTGDLKWGAMRCADAFALPSHQENFGIAVVEALACELPVLITTGINIHAKISAANAGFVEPDTLSGARSLLSRWRIASREQTNAMRKAAFACFQTEFDIRRTTEDLLAVIAEK